MKDFRAQLIGAEKIIESRVRSLVQSMAAMYVNTNSSTNISDNGGSSPFPGNSGSSSQRSSNHGYDSNGTGSSQNIGNYPSYQSNGNNGFSSSASGHNGGRSYNSNNFRPRGNGGYKPRFNNSRSGSQDELHSLVSY